MLLKCYLNPELFGWEKESTANQTPPEGESSWEDQMRRERKAREKAQREKEKKEKKKEEGSGGWW